MIGDESILIFHYDVTSLFIHLRSSVRQEI